MPTNETDIDIFLQTATFGDDPYHSFVERSKSEGLPEIQVSAVFGRLLELLVRLSHATTILEIGTLGGYSAAWMARGFRSDGRIISLEIDPHHADVARQNLKDAGFDGVVDVRVGAALDTLGVISADRALAGAIDLAFIDADKVNNPKYVDAVMHLVHPGSLIIVDNVVRRGSVLDDTSDDPNVVGSRDVLTLLGSFPQLTATALQTVGVKGHDGFAIAFVNE